MVVTFTTSPLFTLPSSAARFMLDITGNFKGFYGCTANAEESTHRPCKVIEDKLCASDPLRIPHLAPKYVWYAFMLQRGCQT